MVENDDPTPADRTAPTPELLEDYTSKHVQLLAQTRELERLREQVRGSAEREAAAIVTAARNNVRKVLLDARHDLLVLVAQLQAVGCDAQRNDVQASVVCVESTEVLAPSPEVAAAAPAPDAFGTSQEMVTGARRDVREVLLEAQTELIALSAEARELRARIAKEQDNERDGFEPEALPGQPEPPITDRAPQEAIAAIEETFSSEGVASSEDAAAPVMYAPLSSPSRLWVAVAAAVVFAVVGLSLFSWSGAGDRPASAAVIAAKPPQPATQPVKQENASSAAAVSPSGLTVTVDVRRSAWIRTTIDGRADAGRVYSAGEKRTITATRDVVMRAGDSGAVIVAVNGGTAAPLGGDGRAATRRFAVPVEPPVTRPATLQAAAAPPPAAVPPSGPLQSSRADVGTTGVRDVKPAPARPIAAVDPLMGASAPAGSEAEREILRGTQRWFEAYFEGDRSQMAEIATFDFSLHDQRTDGQRFPASQPGIDRRMQQVRIEVAGDGAVMSGRLTERTMTDGAPREFVSLVSGVWIRREGRWRLMAIRLVDSGNAVPQPR